MVIGCVLRKLSRISTCVDKPIFKMTKSLLEIFLVKISSEQPRGPEIKNFLRSIVSCVNFITFYRAC